MKVRLDSVSSLDFSSGEFTNARVSRMVRTPSHSGQDSGWRIFSDRSVTSILIEPTVEVIEIVSKINKIKYSSGHVEKARVSQISIETDTSECSRLEHKKVGSCLKILPVWGKIRIRPVIAEITVDSNVKRK